MSAKDREVSLYARIRHDITVEEIQAGKQRLSKQVIISSDNAKHRGQQK